MKVNVIHPFETMIVVISRLIQNGESAAVGTLSPIPAAAVYLAKALHAPDMIPMVYNDPDMRVTDGLQEFFCLAHRGMVDLFFLSGIQIDRHGNFNLSVIGDYEKPKIRLPGGAGSNMMIMMAKRTIMFTLTHDTRLFVPQVDFVNGTSMDESVSWRRGKLSHIATPMALFKFDENKRAVKLKAVYPGIPVDDVIKNTGFDLEIKNEYIDEIPKISPEEIKILRGPVRKKLQFLYPRFCSILWDL